MDKQITISELQKQLKDVNRQLKQAEDQLAGETAARERAEQDLQSALTAAEGVKQAYLESEEHYKLLLENTQDIVYAITPEGILTYHGPQISQFGYEPEELISKNFIEFVAPEQRQEVLRRLETGTATGKSFPTEFQLINKDGSRTWVEVVGKTVVDDLGNPVEQIGVLRDISYQKAIENQIHESEEKYRNLVEQINEVIYSIDLDGMITYISPAVESFLDYKTSEIIGLSFYQFIASDDLPSAKDNFNLLSEGTIPKIQEYKALTKSGEVRWMQTSSKPVFKGDQVVGVQGVLTDITDRKLFEMQIKKHAATAERERLARELHDSVTQALFSTCLIADTLPRVWERNPQEGLKGLEQIRRLSHGALAEMRSMLLELRPTALARQNLGDLLRQLSDGMMARTQITITTTIVGDCIFPGEVNVGLYRIAQEALNNIIKHANASVALISLNCASEMVKLSIIDNGRGFDPNTTQPGKFGLKIMYERAQAIDAKIRIESQPEQGTKVMVHWKEQD